MTYTTKELEQYRELEENQEFHEKRDLVRELMDEVREFSDDLTPKDMATISYVMNAQTNHESTHRGSIGVVFKADVLEYSSGGRKIEVKYVKIHGDLSVKKPEQDGQFGKWEINHTRSSSDDHAGGYHAVELKFQEDITVQLKIYDPKRFLLYNGEEVEEEE